jgi:hypothetical protein
MILAKLKTPFERYYQNGIETIVVSCDYISATVENYELGKPELNFYYKLGKLKFDENGNPQDFLKVAAGNIAIKAEDLTDWGADDYKALEVLAEKLNLELEEGGKIDAPNLIFKS